MLYNWLMKTVIIVATLLAVCCVTPAQTNNQMDVDQMLDAAQQYAKQNLDPKLAEAMQDIDRDKVKDFLQHYQDYLQGNRVLDVDVGELEDSAQTFLPLLEAREDTRPMAAWLRERLDYFEAINELQPKNLPPTEPGKPTPPLPNPSFKAERALWTKKVAPRPMPKGAAEVVPTLKKVFASEGVPPELVWLAEVESGFNASAESPAGALGMFQLMPATAKRYGLNLWPFDQRKQPEAAAHAAAKSLHTLHEQFGDWRLAVAAYNCGEGTLQKAMKRHHAQSFESVAPHLPAETQMYVPKVEATILHREGQEMEKLGA